MNEVNELSDRLLIVLIIYVQIKTYLKVDREENIILWF